MRRSLPPRSPRARTLAVAGLLVGAATTAVVPVAAQEYAEAQALDSSCWDVCQDVCKSHEGCAFASGGCACMIACNDESEHETICGL